MTISKRDRDYITWQNRAFWFYVSARACFHKEFYVPAAFLSQQCVEQLLKATLMWSDPSFEPKKHGGHKLSKMTEMIKEKVPGQDDFTVPEYLSDGKYQSLSRYPAPSGQGFGIPGTLVPDVDRLFADLVEMVPFQFNSKLYRTLGYETPSQSEGYKNWYVELERDNAEMERLSTHVVDRGNQH